MRTINTWIGSFLIIAGIIAMAGSANDCDGACMETANTLGEMMMVVFIGLCLVVTGGIFLSKSAIRG
jgi:uncharacterized membrane protein